MLNPLSTVTVFAPATVANVACGYDILGLAINAPGDEITVSLNRSGEITITEIRGDEGKLPLDPKVNSVTVAAQALWESCKEQYSDSWDNFGAEFIIDKKMPFGSGMGSSAASAVAGAYAANAILGSPLTKREVLPFAMLGEQAADGSYHADNVAPSLFGGISLVRSNQELDIIELPVQQDLWVTVVHPKIEILTKDARDILPKQVELGSASRQLGHLGGFIASLYTNDMALMQRSLQDEWIAPHRSQLIPAFSELQQAVMEQGALGFNISGAGPSVFALSQSQQQAQAIADSISSIWSDLNPSVYISTVNLDGAKVVKSEK